MPLKYTLSPRSSNGPSSLAPFWYTPPVEATPSSRRAPPATPRLSALAAAFDVAADPLFGPAFETLYEDFQTVIKNRREGPKRLQTYAEIPPIFLPTVLEAFGFKRYLLTGKSTFKQITGFPAYVLNEGRPFRGHPGMGRQPALMFTCPLYTRPVCMLAGRAHFCTSFSTPSFVDNTLGPCNYCRGHGREGECTARNHGFLDQDIGQDQELEQLLEECIAYERWMRAVAVDAPAEPGTVPYAQHRPGRSRESKRRLSADSDDDYEAGPAARSQRPRVRSPSVISVSSEDEPDEAPQQRRTFRERLREATTESPAPSSVSLHSDGDTIVADNASESSEIAPPANPVSPVDFPPLANRPSPAPTASSTDTLVPTNTMITVSRGKVVEVQLEKGKEEIAALSAEVARLKREQQWEQDARAGLEGQLAALKAERPGGEGLAALYAEVDVLRQQKFEQHAELQHLRGAQSGSRGAGPVSGEMRARINAERKAHVADMQLGSLQRANAQNQGDLAGARERIRALEEEKARLAAELQEREAQEARDCAASEGLLARIRRLTQEQGQQG